MGGASGRSMGGASGARRWGPRHLGLACLCAAGEAGAWRDDAASLVQASLGKEAKVSASPEPQLLMNLHLGAERSQPSPHLVRPPIQTAEEAAQVSLDEGHGVAVPASPEQPRLSMAVRTGAERSQPTPHLVRPPIRASEEAVRAFIPLPVPADTIAGTRESVHNKLVMAGVQLQAKCRNNELQDCHKGKCRQLELHDCGKALELSNLLIWATEIRQVATGRSPQAFEHAPPALVGALLGLRYWLYHPGPTWCFTTLDKDRSGTLTFQELEPSFGTELRRLAPDGGRAMKVRLFELMDADGSSGVTREELASHLQAVVRVRELVPSVDEDPEGSKDAPVVNTNDLLRELKSITRPPRSLQKRMPHWVPPVVIVVMALGAWLAHYFFTRRRSRNVYSIANSVHRSRTEKK